MKTKTPFIIAFLLMALAAFTRLVPHIPNFTALEGITLFGAAYLGSKQRSIFLVLLVMFLTDFILNNTIVRSFFTEQKGLVFFSDYMVFNALSIIAMVWIGSFMLKKVTVLNIGTSALVASFVFFLITNFGAWLTNHGLLYSRDFNGLMQAYIAGYPFLKSSFWGSMLFTFVIFGMYALVNKLIATRSLQNA